MHAQVGVTENGPYLPEIRDSLDSATRAILAA